jgi:hypothetical protein
MPAAIALAKEIMMLSLPATVPALALAILLPREMTRSMERALLPQRRLETARRRVVALRSAQRPWERPGEVVPEATDKK